MPYVKQGDLVDLGAAGEAPLHALEMASLDGTVQWSVPVAVSGLEAPRFEESIEDNGRPCPKGEMQSETPGLGRKGGV